MFYCFLLRRGQGKWKAFYKYCKFFTKFFYLKRTCNIYKKPSIYPDPCATKSSRTYFCRYKKGSTYEQIIGRRCRQWQNSCCCDCYVSCISLRLSIRSHGTDRNSGTTTLCHHFQITGTLWCPYCCNNWQNKASSKHKKEMLLTTHILIGTHAVLSKKINFDNLGFVVIDEQQRFG